jgi:hypothetical protein
VTGPHHRRTGIFLPEVAHPYADFGRAKYQIDFASLTGDTPFLDALNLAGDSDNLSFLVGAGWFPRREDPFIRKYGGKQATGGRVITLDRLSEMSVRPERATRLAN